MSSFSSVSGRVSCSILASAELSPILAVNEDTNYKRIINNTKSSGGVEMSGKSSSSTGNNNMQYFSLRWNNHPVNLVSVFSGLYDSETLVDVTLAAGGKHIMAHKMLLSACSDYFQTLFSTNPCQHPIVILKDVSFDDLQTVVQFMYNGIVNVSSDKLPGVLKTADTLQIKGLGEKFNEGVGHLMDHSSHNDRKGFSIKHDSRLLSVPSTHSGSGDYRQLSTESLPEYLHRSRDYSSRQHSFESPLQSFDSFSGSMNPKLQASPPPLPTNSPPPKHLRKKFRRLSGCGSSSERGNSIEETDRSPVVNRGVSPSIPFSPSRQSSVSSEQETTGTNNIVTSCGSTTIAKKKRELFSSARSSRSGESNKSSMSEHSKDTVENNSIKKASLSSSGQSMSQEENPNTASSSSKSPSLKNMNYKQSSNESNEEMKDEETPSDLSSKFKKKRYLLKRQNRLEKSTLGDTSPSILPSSTDNKSDTGYLSSSFDNIIKSSPSSPLNYNYPTSLTPPVSTHHNLTMTCLPPPPIPPHENPTCTSPSSHTMFHPPININTKSSIPSPLIECHSPSIPTPFSPSLSPPPSSSHLQQFQHQSMKLPHVRVTPDSDTMRMDARSALPPVPNMSLLYPAFEHERRLYKSRPFDHGAIFHQHHQQNQNRPLFPTPTYPTSHSGVMPPNMPPQTTISSSSSTSGINSHSTSNPPPPPPQSSNLLNPLSSAGGGVPGPSDQFGHCPKARDGPALGCNFCWNTTDINGRILRRKTKYHCPECQANLCIVPCFQSYHEALEKEDRQSHA